MDRLVDRQLGAAVCGIGSARDELPDRAHVVVVGGGLVGASLAYHLTLLGETDVLLLERNVLGSGTSWHAAGLVSRGRGSVGLSELAGYGVDCYARLQEETGVDVSFNRCGSLALARTPGRWDELGRQQMVVEQLGAEAHLVGPEDVQRLWPLASPDGLLGGLHQPGDGHVNPGHAAMALARGAHLRGAAVREGVSVLGLVVEEGAVVGVRTDQGLVAAGTSSWPPGCGPGTWPERWEPTCPCTPPSTCTRAPSRSTAPTPGSRSCATSTPFSTCAPSRVVCSWARSSRTAGRAPCTRWATAGSRSSSRTGTTSPPSAAWPRSGCPCWAASSTTAS